MWQAVVAFVSAAVSLAVTAAFLASRAVIVIVVVVVAAAIVVSVNVVACGRFLLPPRTTTTITAAARTKSPKVSQTRLQASAVGCSHVVAIVLKNNPIKHAKHVRRQGAVQCGAIGPVHPKSGKNIRHGGRIRHEGRRNVQQSLLGHLSTFLIMPSS